MSYSSSNMEIREAGEMASREAEGETRMETEEMAKVDN